MPYFLLYIEGGDILGANEQKRTLFTILDKYTEKLENLIMGLGMISISIIVFANVIARYFFNFSLVWSEELSRYIVVWITFFGLSSCARYEEHVRIDLLLNKLAGKGKVILNIIIKLISLLTSMYLAYISIQFTKKQFLAGNTSIAIAIPIWLIYLSTSIGFSLLSYVYFRDVVKLSHSLKEGVK